MLEAEPKVTTTDARLQTTRATKPCDDNVTRDFSPMTCGKSLQKLLKDPDQFMCRKLILIFNRAAFLDFFKCYWTE